MKKVILSVLALLSLTACATRQNSHCPKGSVDENGYLLLKKGETLKCQVLQSTSNLGCRKMTDKTQADGWACSFGKEAVLFLFDENEKLIDYRYFK